MAQTIFKKRSHVVIYSGLWGLGVGIAVLFYVFRPFSDRMSSYVTDLSPRTAPQRQNIERASLVLRGVILESGQVFSMNQWAGPYSLEKGYLPERSLRDGQTTVSPGGGVCQVASTLYNAVRLAGLEILERVPHSGPVHSVAPGFDATVAYGIADLKFKNPYDFPVRIDAKTDHQQLVIEVWGKEFKKHE